MRPYTQEKRALYIEDKGTMGRGQRRRRWDRVGTSSFKRNWSFGRDDETVQNPKVRNLRNSTHLHISFSFGSALDSSWSWVLQGLHRVALPVLTAYENSYSVCPFYTLDFSIQLLSTQPRTYDRALLFSSGDPNSLPFCLLSWFF